MWHHMTSPATPPWRRAKSCRPWSLGRTDTHWWSSGHSGIPVLEMRNNCESPTSGQLDWNPQSSTKHFRSIRRLQLRVWGRQRVGKVKHRRTRMSTDGMTTRTRPFNCCAARTCTSGGRPKGNILGGETTSSGKRLSAKVTGGGGGGGGGPTSFSKGFQEDHVDVTNWLDLLNRSMTNPPPWILMILCLVNLRNKLLWLEICRLTCVRTVNIHDARSARLAQWYTSPTRPTRSSKGVAPRGGASRNYLEWRFDTKEFNDLDWWWSAELFISTRQK